MAGLHFLCYASVYSMPCKHSRKDFYMFYHSIPVSKQASLKVSQNLNSLAVVALHVCPAEQTVLNLPIALGRDHDRGFHIGMNTTVIGIGSRRVEDHHEGLVLRHIGRGGEGIAVTGHRMRRICRIGPHHLRSFGNGDRGWLERIFIVLFDHLHLHHLHRRC